MAQLVTDFYTGWLGGRPKAQALREAQLKLLSARGHPYYWAPLVLVGNQN
jgi:CHAT domain-containing protein